MATTRSLVLHQGPINRILKGSGGDVNRMMTGFRRLAVSATRKVADERITHQTGKYRRSIKAIEKTPTKIEVRADAAHAAILEGGSRPHRIVARRSSALAFEVAGNLVFARAVNHPGTKPYHILRDGVKDAGKQIKSLSRR